MKRYLVSPLLFLANTFPFNLFCFSLLYRRLPFSVLLVKNVSCSTSFLPFAFVLSSTENANFWPILTNLGYFVANFQCTFTGLNNVAVYQNGQISGMIISCSTYSVLWLLYSILLVKCISCLTYSVL